MPREANQTKVAGVKRMLPKQRVRQMGVLNLQGMGRTRIISPRSLQRITSMLEPEGVKPLIAIVLLKEYELKETIKNSFYYHHSCTAINVLFVIGTGPKRKNQ